MNWNRALLTCVWCCTLASLTIAMIHASGQLPGTPDAKSSAVKFHQVVHTSSGIVVLSYDSRTNIQVVGSNGNILFQGPVHNDRLQQIPLAPGSYTILSNDDVLVVATDLHAYNTRPTNPGSHQTAAANKGQKRYTGAPTTRSAPTLQVLPVPWVGDSTYADNPPSAASRHTVFGGVATRLKAAIVGGAPPYSVTWDPGDGSGAQAPFNAAIATVITGPPSVGTDNLAVASNDGFTVGDQILVDSGSNSESFHIASIAAAASTSLNGDWPAGTNQLSVYNCDNFFPGDNILINGETLTVTANSGHVSTTILGDQKALKSIVTVASTSGFYPDDFISLDGEWFSIASIPDSTHFILNGCTWQFHHDGGVVTDISGRLALSSPTAIDHFDDEQVTDAFVHLGIDAVTAKPHVAGIAVMSNTGARVQSVGCAIPWTYTRPIGTLIHATVTVVDHLGATGSADYYVRVGDPANQTDRVGRSADEALWYLHGQITRLEDVTNFSSRTGSNEPTVSEGYITQNYLSGFPISPSAMYAVALENSGRSIEGGVNFSHQWARDAYVDDLNRLINFLTDTSNLIDVSPGYYIPGYGNLDFQKTYATGGLLGSADTHPAGGNGFLLTANSYRPIYEGGLQLQAIAQAGFVDSPVANRSEYSSYYDLIGDFVDGFQYSQAAGPYFGDPAEGGWRFDFGYGDSDGAATPWACMGLQAAERANELTPYPRLHAGSTGKIVVDPLIKSELGIWLNTAQTTDTTLVYTTPSLNYLTGSTYDFHAFGGFGLTDATLGMNSGKTAGGILGLNYIGKADTDHAIVNATDFLFRNFYTPDYWFGWSSNFDAYTMYQMAAALNDIHVQNLQQSTAPGVVDTPGNSVTQIPWMSVLQDFIAGTGQVITDSSSNTYLDLGHQFWPGNNTNFTHYSAAGIGHFEPIGARNWPVAPMSIPEWNAGISDTSADVNLITAWDIAVLMGQVYSAGPVARFGHPTGSEVSVPQSINGLPFGVVFDPGGSSESAPSGSINRVKWDFGDGSAPLTYSLGAASAAGGTVPLNISGNRTVHTYAFDPHTLPRQVTVSLTVYDDQGLSDIRTETLTVGASVYSPVARFAVTSATTRQNGDTVGISDSGPDVGKVTLQFDGTASSNGAPSTVLPARDAKGVSSFAWEWPTSSLSSLTGDVPPSVNLGGTGADPFGLDEGALDMTGVYNAGSKNPKQTYTFYFGADPSSWPSAIQVALVVTSNLPGAPGANANTVVRTIKLLPDSLMPVTALQVRNVTAHNITDQAVIISFDTTDSGGLPVASLATVNYGATAAYGGQAKDTSLRTHHDVTLTSLSPGSTYHFDIAASGGGQNAASTDYSFKTLVTGVGISLSITSAIRLSNGQIQVVWRATDIGTTPAVGFVANAFDAVAPASAVSVNGIPQPPAQSTAIVTVPSGSFTEFTVNYGGVPGSSTGFFARFNYSYKGVVTNTGYIRVSGWK